MAGGDSIYELIRTAGFIEGRNSLREGCAKEPNEFILVVEDALCNAKWTHADLTEEQLKKLYQLYNNQISCIQEEANKRGLEL